MSRQLSHPARGAWIEMSIASVSVPNVAQSHPARGAWIEIQTGLADLSHRFVAPRTGCVD